MSALPKSNIENNWTLAEYHLLAQSPDTKYEFAGGMILSMTGASLRHNRITRNVTVKLSNLLKGHPCEALPSDMRVRTPSGLYAYPDVTVVCGDVQIEVDHGLDTLLNPTVIVEVLSPSTADYDSRVKLDHYQTLASLHEYVLIDQAQPHIKTYSRHGEGQWLYTMVNGLDASIALPSIEVTLALADIYAQV
ncbi:MAG: Uma2 family endonuclease [bacterium]|nr:Uma2 family endonuclease [bacterium]